MSRILNLILWMVLLLGFTACVNNSDDLSSVGANQVQYPPGELSLALSANEINADKTVKGYPVGGQAPYTFSMDTGTGTIDAALGEFSPDPTFSGPAIMRVTDANKKSATATVYVYPPLKMTPLSSIKYVSEVIDITTSGGKPPYTVQMVTGAGTMTNLSSSVVRINLPAVASSILMVAFDALGNKATADILVLDPLTVVMGGETIASIQEMTISIKGGKTNSTGDFTVTKLVGQGTLVKVDARNYKFVPAANVEQKGASAVQIKIDDDNGQSVTKSFEVFVAPTVVVGDNHSCALDNISGKMKCWGENLRGQLGYGGDPNRQQYWGDEPSEQSTVTENFKQVEFLTSAEKASGGFIVDYAFAYDTTCAIIDVGGMRDIRCWGSNTQSGGFWMNSANSSLYTYNTNRHPYLNASNVCSTSSGSCTTGSYGFGDNVMGDNYRYDIADPLAVTGYYVSAFFPRMRKTMPFETNSMMDSFGLGSLDWGHPELFNYYKFYDATYGFKANRIYLWDDYGYGAYVGLNILGVDNNIKLTGGGVYNSMPGNSATIPGSVKFKDMDFELSRTSHSCYIGTDDYLYCEGGNGGGVLGINQADWNFGAGLGGPNYPSRVVTAPGGGAGDSDKVKMISVPFTDGGWYAFCAIFDGNPVIGASDDVVGCWGSNAYYALGINSTAGMNALYPATFVQYFDSGTGTYQNLKGITKIKSDSTTGMIACALKSDGTLWCWGSASSGKIPGYATDRPAAVKVTSPFAVGETVLDFDIQNGGVCAIAVSSGGVKTLKCWGYSDRRSYQIPKLKPGAVSGALITNVTGTIDPISVRLSPHAGCLLPSDRTYLKCWGDNRRGMLGMGNGNRGDRPLSMGTNLPYVDVGTGRTVKAMSLGAEHTCAILDNDYLKCWGSNQFGQLGLGLATGYDAYTHKGDNANEMGDSLPTISFPGDPNSKVKFVTSGKTHICAVTLSENLYCWGDNSVGQLGLSGVAAATRVYNQPAKVDITGIGTVTALALGAQHTCALFDLSGTQSLRCWGSHESGQLGYGDISVVNGIAGNYGTLKRIGDQSTDVAIKNLPAVDLGDFSNYKVKSISAGALHTCVLFDNGKVRCFGADNFGQIGIGSYDLNNDSVNDNVGDELFETGYKMFVDFGTNPLTGLPHKALQITSGTDFNCALLDSGKVKCWGSNILGQLGIENTVSAGIANNQMGSALPYVNLEPGAQVLSVQSGLFHSCAVLDNSKVKCWGMNYVGQLGFGSDYSRGSIPYSMGLSLPNVDLGW